MTKNNENQKNVELTPAVAMEALFPTKELTPQEAMDGLYPKAVVADPYQKVPSDVRDKAIGYQDSDERTNMIAKIREAIIGIPNYTAVLAGCAMGGAIHPGKLETAIKSHLPHNWEVALRDDVDKTPQEQLATIAVGVPRGIVREAAELLIVEYGLTKDEQTRSLKKAIRAKAIDQVSRVVPLKVAKATQANYRDKLLEGLKAILSAK